MTPSTALVTGASGFVGRHLCAALVRDGWQVRALVRATTDATQLPAGVGAEPLPATARELGREIVRLRPQVVFHLATLFRGVHAVDDVEPLIASNVLLGSQLAEALTAAPPAAFINTGTAWQQDEAGRYRPAALYAATKQAMEDILRYYAQSGAYPAATVRLFDTYGPGDQRGRLVSALACQPESGEPLQMSPGEQLIDLLHVDDVVRALRRAAEVTAEGATSWSVWSAGSGRRLTVRDLVVAFERATGRAVPVVWGARPYRPVEMFARFDAGPRVPGWQPSIELEDGLARTYGGTEAGPRRD